jgi:hypothetical protein
MCYVDGKLVVGGKVPAPNEVQRAIEGAFHRKKSG